MPCDYYRIQAGTEDEKEQKDETYSCIPKKSGGHIGATHHLENRVSPIEQQAATDRSGDIAASNMIIM